MKKIYLLLVVLLLSLQNSFTQPPVKQWDARFGGSNADYLFSVHQTMDDGYILGGFSDSPASGDKTQIKIGKEDFWIVKSDAAGLKLWDARFGGNAEDLLRTIQQTSDGGYIM